MTNVNDIVNDQIAAARRKHKAQQQRRDELAEARKHGLVARHRNKLARIGQTEQRAMRVALAALRRDPQGVALALSSVPTPEVRQVASVALAALAELALTAPPGNIGTTVEALTRMADSGPTGPAA
ncbi:hypothetical protein GCM10011583_57690 [Streptomyces camponoticapitis]|uniref:Uncharacterized protein n=1 Tax=Streptomyces camponoticapitis TaxID=1616125 RepID=A0ABQ2ER40_9ACTN|nr:hypothetical protein [Streptomyces camponoticapitis]GGK18278.1 hypothetical protein GCM10011583_57690 [Streptomyces camponoticapitis]